MNEDRERFRSHLTAPQQKTDWSGLWWCIAIVIGVTAASVVALFGDKFDEEEEGSAARQLYLVWCRGSGLHADHHVCRDGYTAASATEEPKERSTAGS